MATTSTPSATSEEVRAALGALFENPPVLVEVRFPSCGTSSDWRLCEDQEELDAILSRLAPGAELHLNSVWDLTSGRRSLVMRN